MAETLPPPIAGAPALSPVTPPAGAPDHRPESGAAAGAAFAPAAEALDFLDPAAGAKTIPLGFPFRHAGAEIRSIRIRRLTVTEVAAWAKENAAGRADAFDLYAAMAGLPAAVLRGLEADDGARLMEAAHDFLPRWLRTEADAPALSTAGAPMP